MPNLVTLCMILLLAACAFGAGSAPPVEQRLVEGDNRFAFRLFGQLTTAKPNPDVFISPMSVATALAMTWDGAKGPTQAAMGRALGLEGLSQAEVEQGNLDLRKALTNAGPEVKLDIANALWADDSFHFAPAFEERIARYYGGRATSLNFGEPAAAETINRWVSEKTAGMIRELVTPMDLRSSRTAVLTNAIYFKGEWEERFDPKATRQAPFHLPDGSEKSVPLMSQTGSYAYRRSGGAQVAELPYAGKRLSMLIALPAPGTSLAAFLRGLDEKRWTELTRNLRPTEIHLSLPRFKVSASAELKRPLIALGMEAAFGPGADFSGMGRGLWIDQVKHKAVMEVNEQGTEAAGATAVIMTRAARLTESMMVDRPFVCAIRDNRTGALLFMGAIANPQ